MALSGQYVELSEIIERLYRKYPISEEIKISDAALWAFDILNSLGIPDFYIEKTTNGLEDNPSPIVIENYRGSLPLDIHSIYLVRDYDTQLPMYCTSSPFKSDSTIPLDPYESSLTYHTNNSFIFTSFEEGNLEMVYRAFPTSPMGLPMIPSETRIINAIVSNIAYNIYRILWHEDRISEAKFRDVEQEALFYLASGSTKGRVPSIDQMESLKNRWMRLIQDPNLHGSSFRYIANKDRLILHLNRSNG